MSSVSPSSSASQAAGSVCVAPYDATAVARVVEVLAAAGVAPVRLASYAERALGAYKAYLRAFDVSSVSVSGDSIVSASSVSDAGSGSSGGFPARSVSGKAVSPSRAGRCYLKAVQPARREAVGALLGSYPALGRIASCPREWFLSDEELGCVRVTPGSANDVLHLQRGFSGESFPSLLGSAAKLGYPVAQAVGMPVEGSLWERAVSWPGGASSLFAAKGWKTRVGARTADPPPVDVQYVPNLGGPTPGWLGFIHDCIVGNGTGPCTQGGSSYQDCHDVSGRAPSSLGFVPAGRLTSRGLAGGYTRWLAAGSNDGFVATQVTATTPDASAVLVVTDAYRSYFRQVVVDGLSYEVPLEGALCVRFRGSLEFSIPNVVGLYSVALWVYEGSQ